MITLTTENLEWQTFNKNKSEIIFENIAYIRKKIFSKKHKEQAVNLARQYGSNKLKSMLVEHKLFFSVWVEKSTSFVQEKQPKTALKKQQILEDQQMIKDHNNLDDFLSQKFSELGL